MGNAVNGNGIKAGVGAEYLLAVVCSGITGKDGIGILNAGIVYGFERFKKSFTNTLDPLGFAGFGFQEQLPELQLQ
jgi:hypothetical protein